MTAGSWAREIAQSYDRIAADFESRPDDPRSTLAATLNRSEAAKYHKVAANMDAAFPLGLPPDLPEAVMPVAPAAPAADDRDHEDRYRGVKALFNGDLHLIDPSYAPRED